MLQLVDAFKTASGKPVPYRQWHDDEYHCEGIHMQFVMFYTSKTHKNCENYLLWQTIENREYLTHVF